MPHYSIIGSISLPKHMAYILLREDKEGHSYGVALYGTATTDAKWLAPYVSVWHRNVDGAMAEVDLLRTKV